MNNSLSGRTAIITGGSHGLGYQIAKQFLSRGVNVSICGRDRTSLKEAYKELNTSLKQPQQLIAEVCDVSKIEEVKAFIDTTALAFDNRIDILVNNAGIYGPKGLSEEVSWADWVSCIEINLFGSVLMCRAVLPYMKKRRYGKIIQLSGGGATQPMPRFSSYAASKAAVVRFAESLALEVKEFNIDINSIAAGALNTRFLDEVIAAGPQKVGDTFYKRSLQQRENGGVSMEIPVGLIEFLASSESDGLTGKVISAVWDNWEKFAHHKNELISTDVYTLRRIIGKDRGFLWGDK